MQNTPKIRLLHYAIISKFMRRSEKQTEKEIKKSFFPAFSGGSLMTRLQRTQRGRNRPNTRKPFEKLSPGMEARISDFGWRAADAGLKPLAAAHPSGPMQWARATARYSAPSPRAPGSSPPRQDTIGEESRREEMETGRGTCDNATHL